MQVVLCLPTRGTPVGPAGVLFFTLWHGYFDNITRHTDLVGLTVKQIISLDFIVACLLGPTAQNVCIKQLVAGNSSNLGWTRQQRVCPTEYLIRLYGVLILRRWCQPEQRNIVHGDQTCSQPCRRIRLTISRDHNRANFVRCHRQLSGTRWTEGFSYVPVRVGNQSQFHQSTYK
jgi:hypothetical protein